MTTFKKICLISVASAAIASTAAAQSGDFYSRDKYEAVRDRAQPEFDPEPVRLGAFVVRPKAEAGALYTSNAFAQNNNEESDLIARIGAEASGETDWNVHEVGFDVSAYRNQYVDFNDESTNELAGRLRGRLDVTRELSLGGNVFLEDRAEPRSDFANAIGVDRPVEYNTSGFGADVNYQNDRVRWINNITWSNYDYEDGNLIGSGLPVDQDYRDLDRLEGRTRLSYAVSPNVAVYGQASASESDYDQGELIGGTLRQRDTKGYTVAAGVDFELTTLVRGDIAVGYLNEDKEDDFFKDVDGLSLDARVQWFPSRLTTVSFDAGRRIVDIGVPQAPSALNTTVGARVDYELRRNIIVSAFGGRNLYDYQELDREDEIFDIGAGATYKLNKRVHVEGFVRRLDRDTSGTAGIGGPSYGINLAGLTLKLFP